MGRSKKARFFGIAPKRQKSEDKPKLGSPYRHFGWKSMTLGIPFGIDFSMLEKGFAFHCKTIVFACFALLNTFFLRSKFHWFLLFFQNRPQGAFLEGPSADLYWKVRFWCHFRFSEFSKKAPESFLPKICKGEVVRVSLSVLAATLLFTKPW